MSESGVTGLGAVTRLGNDVQSTRLSLMAGCSGVGSITRFDPSDFVVKFACKMTALPRRRE